MKLRADQFLKLHIAGMMLSCVCTPFLMQYLQERTILLTPYGLEILAPFAFATFLLLVIPSPILMWVLRRFAQIAQRVPLIANHWPVRIAVGTLLSVVLGVTLAIGWELASLGLATMTGANPQSLSGFFTDRSVERFTQAVAAFWLLPALLVLKPAPSARAHMGATRSRPQDAGPSVAKADA